MEAFIHVSGIVHLLLAVHKGSNHGKSLALLGIITFYDNFYNFLNI
jgi:uncharacterized membrane protein HdeD (DUF308 family)